jgi:hypothetical protein
MRVTAHVREHELRNGDLGMIGPGSPGPAHLAQYPSPPRLARRQRRPMLDADNRAIVATDGERRSEKATLVQQRAARAAIRDGAREPARVTDDIPSGCKAEVLTADAFGAQQSGERSFAADNHELDLRAETPKTSGHGNHQRFGSADLGVPQHQRKTSVVGSLDGARNGLHCRAYDIHAFSSAARR